MGRWEAAVEEYRQAEHNDPRSVVTLRRLGTALVNLRRYPEAREALGRALALAPTDLGMIEYKAMTFLGEADLAGARAVLDAVPQGVEPTALIVVVATYQDLVWVLDEQQRDVLLRLSPSAFDNDQGLYHARGMDATGLFPIYFTPNGHPASFGDSPAVPAHGAFYLLPKQYAQREVTWWLDTYAFRADADATSWASAGLGMLLRPVDAESPKVPELATLKVFHEIGWAAMADGWPRPSFSRARSRPTRSSSTARASSTCAPTPRR
jgi:tetratricopeptide (TPR) repeat protein